MKLSRIFIPFLLLSLVAVGCSSSPTTSDVAKDDHVTAELLSDHSEVKSDEPFYLAVHLKPEPGWHVYWKNPGDSGLAPKFNWTLPSGFVLNAPLWPAPQRIETSTLVNYGYDETVISFPATVSSVSGRNLPISLKLTWLVCKEECLPGSAELKLNLKRSETNSAFALSESAFIQKALATVPRPLSKVAIAVEERDAHITVSLLPLSNQKLPSHALFFPEDAKVISNSALQEVTHEGDALRFTLMRAANATDTIERVRAVLYSDQGWNGDPSLKAVSIDTDEHAEDPSQNIVRSSAGALTSLLPPNTQPNFFIALILAFIGGIILNLMPCVFPVLSIKILGFMQHANEEPKKVRAHGLAFFAGVVASFWVLASFFLGIKAAGTQLGWGFQLQSPVVVALMIVLFFALGIFFLTDFVFGSSIQNAASKAKSSHSYSSSFLSGVLATAVATPCTGPFMGSALAATLTLSAIPSFLIFTALGVGMGLPYYLLTLMPKLLAFLPRPGAWMETFKQFMAFPMFASAIWLTRVLGRQFSLQDPGLGLLISIFWGLLFCAMALWVYSRMYLSSSRAKRIGGMIASSALLLFGVYIGYPRSADVVAARMQSSSGGMPSTTTDSYGQIWSPYSAEKVQSLIASRTPIYIDFTAEWCITCQVNKRSVFSSADVREELKRKGVALLRADWTAMDSSITSALARYGRTGIPLNVLHKGRMATEEAGAPHIFPNILTAGIVLDELRLIHR